MHPQHSARAQPPVSSQLCSESARTDGDANEVRRGGGRVEEGSSGQQDTRDDADAPSLVLLLSAAVLCVRDKPPGSLLFSPEGTGTDGQEDGGRGEEGRQGTSGYADAPSLVPLLFASILRTRNEPPGSSLFSSENAETPPSRKEPAGLLLLCYEGADKDREVEEERGGGGRGEQAGNKFSK